MTPFPSKELTLNFSIEEIKEKIDLIIDKSNANYQLKEKNELFNTYRIAISKNLMVEYLSITLNKIDDSTTKAQFQMAPPPGSRNPDAGIMSQFMDGFLTVLSQALSGEEVTTKMVGKTASGCMIFFVVFGITISMIYWLS